MIRYAHYSPSTGALPILQEFKDARTKSQALIRATRIMECENHRLRFGGRPPITGKSAVPARKSSPAVNDRADRETAPHARSPRPAKRSDRTPAVPQTSPAENPARATRCLRGG